MVEPDDLGSDSLCGSTKPARTSTRKSKHRPFRRPRLEDPRLFAEVAHRTELLPRRIFVLEALHEKTYSVVSEDRTRFFKFEAQTIVDDARKLEHDGEERIPLRVRGRRELEDDGPESRDLGWSTHHKKFVSSILHI